MLVFTDSVSMLPAELSDTSLSDVQQDYDSVSDSISKLKQEERNIKEAKTGELKDMQDQINALMEQMNQKKEIMMQELERKMELFRQQKRKAGSTNLYAPDRNLFHSMHIWERP